METQTAISTKNKKGFTYSLTSFGKAFIDYAAQAPKPVMDIGAAYGVATLPALDAGAKVIAVDVEEKHLVAIANSIDPSQTGQLITLQEKFPDFELPAESISAVYMSQVLPFLKGEEIEQGAKKIYDWLTPGGQVFIVSFTPYISHVASFIPLYEERKRAGVRWAGYVQNLSRFSDDPNIFRHLPNEIHHVGLEDLRWTFEQAGFEIKEARYFGEEEGALPEGIRMDGRERVGLIATKPETNNRPKTNNRKESQASNKAWKKISSIKNGQVPRLVWDWLHKPFVLSKALKKVCHDFSVQVADQSIKSLHEDEIIALNCQGIAKGYVRETYLGEKNNPLVYARVTMPMTTYAAKKNELDNLGNRPIGETLLYNDITMVRSEMEVKQVTQDDELLFDALVHQNFYMAAVAKSARLPELWARRSIFRISGMPLLITEVFMANLPDYID